MLSSTGPDNTFPCMHHQAMPNNKRNDVDNYYVSVQFVLTTRIDIARDQKNCVRKLADSTRNKREETTQKKRIGKPGMRGG